MAGLLSLTGAAAVGASMLVGGLVGGLGYTAFGVGTFSEGFSLGAIAGGLGYGLNSISKPDRLMTLPAEDYHMVEQIGIDTEGELYRPIPIWEHQIEKFPGPNGVPIYDINPVLNPGVLL